MAKKVWLSIDWDFFQEERLEWDWGHAETNIFQQIAWVSRAFFLGGDIKAITHPDASEPKASEFWEKAAKHWDFSQCMSVMVADSHVHALPFFFVLEGSADELWNFDAHHDLGYTELETLKKWAKLGKAEAGSWAYVLMSRLKKLKYVHLHPVWKDHNIEPTQWRGNKSVQKRVTQLSASKVDWNEPVEVTALFIAKSTGWSPPWNDGEFKKFIQQAEHHTGLSFPDEDDCIEPRQWDEQASQASNEFFKMMLDRRDEELMKEKRNGQPKSKEGGGVSSS